MDPRPYPLPPAAGAAPAARRKALLTALALAAGGALFGFGFGVVVRHVFGAAPGVPWREHFALNLWTLLALPLMWWLTVVFHEFGHLAGGRLAGMRPLMLFAGPLFLDFGADRMRVRFNRVLSAWGGLAACAPSGSQSRGGFALLVLGGPLASVVLAALGIAGGFALGGWLGGFLLATGALSALIAAATLLPLRAGGFMSDGGQLLGLIRNDRSTRQRLALAALMAQSFAGTRARDWDPALLGTLGTETSDPTLRAIAILFAAARAHDCGDLEAADGHWRALAQLLASAEAGAMSPAVRRGFALPLAGWLGHERDDAVAARAWFDASGGGFADPAARAYVEAAVLGSEGRHDDARAALTQARSLLARCSDRGAAVMLAEALERLERKLPPAGRAVAVAVGA